MSSLPPVRSALSASKRYAWVSTVSRLEVFHLWVYFIMGVASPVTLLKYDIPLILVPVLIAVGLCGAFWLTVWISYLEKPYRIITTCLWSIVLIIAPIYAYVWFTAGSEPESLYANSMDALLIICMLSIVFSKRRTLSDQDVKWLNALERTTSTHPKAKTQTV